jgi:2-polyprenyl-6-methoxyphenol hydroxylase-like FAD-dependent oxidoreductase
MPYNADSPEQGYLFRRSGLLNRLYEFATGLGIDMRFGVRVESYWETDHNAGILVNNERIIGDCVIAADGINSKARDNNIGTDVAPQDVGAIIYRAIFDASELSGVPEAQWILEGTSEVDTYEAYCGKGIFILAGTAANGRYVYWTCTLRVSSHPVNGRA